MSGRSHLHVGPLFHKLEGYDGYDEYKFMLMVVCWCDRAGQIGVSESLRREGWGEGRGYCEVPRW
jgi:hypothetical protein